MEIDVTIESTKDEDEGKKTKQSYGKSDRWITRLAAGEKELKKFWERGRRVVKKYMDDSADTDTDRKSGEKFNVFWSNVGVLKASLYAIPPKPVVKREFDDYQDQVGRVASVMMERLLNQPFEDTDSDMNSAFKQTVEDRLVPGIGQMWLRYCPEFEDVEIAPEVRSPKGKLLKAAEMGEQITDEEVAIDYVYWEDFIWSPCRIWAECTWVARRVWMTQAEMKKRFPDADLANVNFVTKKPNKYGERITPESMGGKKAEVFEIWNKTNRTVIFLCKNLEELLEVQGDPLELANFFPCPPPLHATTTTSSTVPKADYMMMQSQYARLDNLTSRIDILENAIQVSGVYDKANKELGQILDGTNRSKMIPVDNWAMFSEKGGLKGVVDWFPLEMVVDALDKLRELKTEAKGELYELSGISDIMRGTTAPRETAQAQNLKAQYSSVRLQYVQNEVAEFIQAALRIKAEIIANHFQPETIVRNSLIELTPDAEYAEEAVQLIKDKWTSCYRIKVFADTLSIPDYNAERQGRTEFITAMGQFISQVIPLVEMDPGAGPFLMQIIQWGVSSFRSAQSIEGVFQKALTQMVQAGQQPKPEKPDPALLKANAEVQSIQAKTQAHVKSLEIKTQSQVRQDQIQAESQAAQNADQIEANRQKVQAETTAMVTKAVLAVLEHQAAMKKQEEEHQQGLRHTEEMAAAKLAAAKKTAAAPKKKGTAK